MIPILISGAIAAIFTLCLQFQDPPEERVLSITRSGWFEKC